MSDVYTSKEKEDELVSSLENIVLSYLFQLGVLESLAELVEDKSFENNKDTLDKQEHPKMEFSDIDTSNSLHGELQSLPKGLFNGLGELFCGFLFSWFQYKYTKKELLYRSLLIQSIALWESFIKDYLRETLQYKPGPLKALNTEKISIAEILKAEEEYSSIRSMIVEKYLDMLFFGKNIDEIRDELTCRKIIDMGKFQGWDTLREAYYRRNLFTHNDGRLNKLYCKKIGIDPCSVDEPLELNRDYLKKITEILREFIKFFHDNNYIARSFKRNDLWRDMEW